MRQALALRRSLLHALGLAPVVLAACADHDDDGADTDGSDTDGVADSDTLRDTSPVDTGVADTDDTVVDTDASDTDAPDTDAPDTDTAVPACGPLPDAITEIKTQGYLSGLAYQVCLAVPYADPACAAATTADIDTTVNAYLSGGGVSSAITCGPFPGPSAECCFDTELYQWVIGRPFATDDGYRTAGVVDREGWSAPLPTLDGADRTLAAAAWEAIGLGEHASVASFATFVLDLLTLGAPADLVGEASAAMGDEVRHAQGAFALASALRGAPVGPGPLPTADARARTSHADLLRAVIVEGCVGETLAAHEAAVARDRAVDPAVRGHLAEVADDEARHAALAWRTVRWILDARPDLAPVADAAFADAVADVRARTLASAGPDLPALGLVGGAVRLETAARGLDRVVVPTWAALRGAIA